MNLCEEPSGAGPRPMRPGGGGMKFKKMHSRRIALNDFGILFNSRGCVAINNYC